MTYARNSGALAKVDAFICLTEFARGKLMSAGIAPERIHIRPNAIDASRVSPAIGSGEYVAFIGRLSAEKGLWTLVHAFERLQGPILKIAGTGPLEQPIREYLKSKNIQNIELVGFISGDAKAEFIKKSMFTVVPSEWYEMFPLVMLEAWAAGKPVISAQLGAMPELVHNGKNGLLFSVGDAGDLAEKINHLFHAPELVAQMGTVARKMVETEFSLKANDELLVRIFSKVCGLDMAVQAR
jgi:glycosyltransferase involved in cell wall biosynthesis